MKSSDSKAGKSDQSVEASDNQSPAPGGAGPIVGIFSAWKNLLKSRGAMVLIGFAISAVFLVLIVQRLRWEDVEIAFARAVWLPWLPMAIAVYILGMLLRGVRLKLLVKDESAISVGTASNIIAVGY
ncbi:MAG: hypothetical protein K8F91_01760, partial [Candidatus Obscuribacterales bacterium]|nr:hypothetical protein [Candidatus Obscuribacterales bacterium]